MKPMGAFKSNSQQLMKAWPRMSERERAQVGVMHLHYEDRFREALGHQPEGLAVGLHEHTDQDVIDLMKKARADEVSCTKGCTHCCRLNVDVTLEEAQLLLYAAQEAAYAFDEARVMRQARAAAWSDLEAPDRACVFLGADGACAVYEHRPMSCRKYFVVSPAEECDTLNHPGQQVLNFVSIEAEVFTSAAFGVFEAGRMASMLIRAAEENNKRSDLDHG